MLVQFNTKNSEINSNTLDIMESKILKKFSRYFSDTEENETILTVKISDKKLSFKVELTLPYYGYMLRSETYDDVSPLAALDKAMDIMERRMSKSKTKIQNKKYQTIDLPGEYTADTKDKTENASDSFSVVRIKSYEMKPMSVQDAILHMNMLGHVFFTFCNAETGKISTVYKRTDEDYGMIEPV